MWLARGAIFTLLVTLPVLLLFGPRISTVTDGNSIVYSPSLVLPVISFAFAVIIGVGAVVFWMQPRGFSRSIAAALALVALYVLFNAPTGLNHRLVVTPHSFDLRIGSWYAPQNTKLDFTSLHYLSVDQLKDGGYEINAITREGTQTSIPVNDLLKKALPEILRGAAQSGVVIGDSAEDFQIPGQPKAE